MLNETLRSIFGTEPEAMVSVAGGDINAAWCLTMKDGARVFMKANRSAPPSFFEAEAEGLSALRAVGALNTPEVVAAGRDERLGSFLLLRWVEAGPRARDFWEAFGRGLAALHAAPAGDRFGWERDNFIGATPQRNAARPSWTAFFRDCRLAPQFRRAEGWFDAAGRRRVSRLLDHLEDHLTEPARPALLHGDLWSGNFITGPDGRAWLIDPAVYRGHPEADLAMTELFGGFPPAFYGAYREVRPLQTGYPRRRELYNLYHLLNHRHLFGGSWLGAVEQTLKDFAG